MQTKTNSDLLLHDLFDRVAVRWPGRVAVDVPPGLARSERRTITYAALKRMSDALAHDLSPFVTGESVVVIIASRRSEHLYAAQLGVLKAGAAYTCIDPMFPDDQLLEILGDSAAVAVLADREGRARALHAGIDPARVIDVAQATDINLAIDPPTRPSWLDSRSLAYVIYTSGTTGRPKGVMIEHAGVVNLVEADRDDFALSPDDRVAQHSSAVYDSSVEEIWLAFAAGATLVVMDDDTARLGPDLVPWLHRERLTVLCPPPTMLRTLGCEDPRRALPDLKLLYVGGEALTQDVADRWAPGRRLVNGYGPTEVTVTSMRGSVEAGQPVSIGVPVRHLRAYVLNESLSEVREGEEGELCLSGVGLARGYRDEPALTARKFPIHPSLGRIYRTGDLVTRARDGRFFCHGRIDAQVKIRGYRVELEAIETRLALCDGVREAACRVQDEASPHMLVGFVVPETLEAPPSLDTLTTSLRAVLPPYMVPSRLVIVEALPKTAGGKIDRKALPVIVPQLLAEAGPVVAPTNDVEARLVSAIRKTLGLVVPISIDADFFADLAGDSLRAALLISTLREDPATASLTVRDIYEARTVAGIAARAPEKAEAASAPAPPAPHARHPHLATCLQIAWLLLLLVVGSATLYALGFDALPAAWRALETAGLGRLGPAARMAVIALLAFIATVAAFPLYTGAVLLAAVLLKKLLIGRYQACRVPVWSAFYVRHWIVQETVRAVPWAFLGGTVFQQMALRALGARIGARVHLHRGVNLHRGGWDLLDIGDDVTVSQEAEIRLVEFDDGQIVIGPVTIDRGSTLDVRSGVGPHTHIEAHAYLTALSSLASGSRIPTGECWDGIPAARVGDAPDPLPLTGSGRSWPPVVHGVAVITARFLVDALIGSPAVLVAIVIGLRFGTDITARMIRTSMLLALTVVPLSVVIAAVIMRALGRVEPAVISRWSPAYIRVWLKTGLVEFAGEWLSGTLFWPTWLRAAGMRIGAGCEISTIIDVVPELMTIGPRTFFADGIYLGGPRVHRGVVTLAEVVIGTNVFLGNHVVIGGGEDLADDMLLGICTVADAETGGAHTSWFGHPPFVLPRREVIELDRRLTHEPSWLRYANRVFWEALRAVLPSCAVLPLLLWIKVMVIAGTWITEPLMAWVVAPTATLGVSMGWGVVMLAQKWALLGRVKPGQHPLWSCWCSRWDFHYVAWAHLGRAALATLEGTLLLNMYLRLMGMRIGARVVLGDGFSFIVDPDMLQFDEGATVEAQFQAHTFEDRVLKIDRVRIRRGATVGNAAVLLYGADIGERTRVAPHSVVMKKERLLPGRSYAGCPIRMVTADRAPLI